MRHELALSHWVAATLLATVAVTTASVACAADPVPTVTLVAIDSDATEAGHVATFLAMRDAASITPPLTIPIAVTGSATAGVDYVSPGATITFPAQTPLITVKIVPIADAVAEGNESVLVSLLPKAGAYTLGDDKSAVATISDAAPKLNWPDRPSPARIPAR